MRPNQKNNRSRGRGRNNNNNSNKNANPLNRSYDSNGPDVRIRGNASHIAEKYSALASDALAAGDGVMAENYFQHAEHYNRIIMAAQAQREEEQREREQREQARGQRNEGQAQNANTGGEQNAKVAEDGTASDSVSGDAGDVASENVEAAEESPRRRPRRRKPREDAAAETDDESKPKNDLADADQPVVDIPIIAESPEAAE